MTELSNSSPYAGCCNLALRTGHIAVLSVLLGDIPGADFWRSTVELKRMVWADSRYLPVIYSLGRPSCSCFGRGRRG